MTSGRILGHLAQRFSPSEENIATEALAWILRRSAAARRAMVDIARISGADLPTDLNFVGQVGDADTGRPDLVGFDENHRERLIIEAKFAAKLTPQQPAGYLQRLLPPDEDGVLLVLAPSARRATLWSDLLKALPETAARAPAPS